MTGRTATVDTGGDVLGTSVGSYEVVAKIAEGGMGAVYRAQHKLLGKPAAIKVILPELSANQELVGRFFNEARAASTIHHPGIVEVYDFGYLPSGLAFIVMELLEGEPLTRRLAARGRLDERTALTILRATAGALAAAHAKGIVHRDLKPDNIYLVPDPDVPGGERPKLLDFGIAKLSEQQGTASQTRSGAMMGTPAYMSPEQCRGAGGVDHRSDIYALGCILYEMLTGRTPFVADGVGELIAAHLMYEPERPSKLVPDLSTATEALVLQLLAKRPEDRVQSATELARMLGQGSIPHIPDGVRPSSSAMSMPPTSPRLPTGSSVSLTGNAGPGPATLGAMMNAAGAAAAQTTPTTLSSATGPRPGTMSDGEPRRSRAGLYAALGAFAVVGGVVAIVLVAGGGKATPAAPPTAPAIVAPAAAIDAGATPTGVAAAPIDAAAVIDPVTAVTPIDAGAAVADVPDPIVTGPAAGSGSKPGTGAGKTGKGRGKTGKGPGSGGTVVPIETEL